MAGVYLAYHWENGRLTINGRTRGRSMIANDPPNALRRAGAPLRPHERRQPRRRDTELGSLDHDAGRRERRSRRPARDAGRDRPRDDGRARHGRSAVARRGRQGAASMPGAPPTCARCATPGLHENALPSRPRRGAHARVVGLRDGVARGQEERRLQGAAADPHRGRDHHPAGSARPRPRRSACRSTTRCSTSTSRAAAAGASTRCSPSSKAFLPAMLQQVMERQQDGRRAVAARRAVPGRGAAHAGRRDGEAPSASTSITAGSTSRRIPSPAARPTTSASRPATTRRISRAP